MLNFDFEDFDASALNRVLRCTVHKSGKLGFTADAIDVLGIKEGMGVRFRRNRSEPDGDNLYMLLIPKANDDKASFRINKAGDYYYCSTKKFFSEIELDYLTKSVYFDLTSVNLNGDTYYKMKQGVSKGRGRDFDVIGTLLGDAGKSIADYAAVGKVSGFGDRDALGAVVNPLDVEDDEE